MYNLLVFYNCGKLQNTTNHKEYPVYPKPDIIDALFLNYDVT